MAGTFQMFGRDDDDNNDDDGKVLKISFQFNVISFDFRFATCQWMLSYMTN